VGSGTSVGQFASLDRMHRQPDDRCLHVHTLLGTRIVLTYVPANADHRVADGRLAGTPGYRNGGADQSQDSISFRDVMKSRGFTLVEVLIAIALMSVLAAALTRMLLSDSRFVSRQEALLTARQTARATINVMSVELRMVSDSGLLAASGDSVLVRIPYAYGIGCDIDGALGRVVSLMPADSLMFANAVTAGIARRRADGTYGFTSPVTISTPADGTKCTTQGIQLIPDGMVLNVLPIAAVDFGDIFYLYQLVTYRFMPSADMPGRRGLWRRVGAGAYEELAAPFDSTAGFRFLVGPNLTVTSVPPADLRTVNGLELNIVAESYEPPRGRSEYQTFELPVQVVFLNKVN